MTSTSTTAQDSAIFDPLKCGFGKYAIFGSLPRIYETLVSMGLSESTTFQFVYLDGRYGIEWTKADVTPHVRSGKFALAVDGVVLKREPLFSQTFPPATSGLLTTNAASRSTWGRSSTQKIEAILTFDAYDTASDASGAVKAAAQALAGDLAVNMREQVPNDVRFTFAGTEATLWMSEAVLAALVPHFKTVLSSSFVEGKKKKPVSSTPGAVLSEKWRPFDASDDETDDLLQRSYPIRVHEKRKPAASAKTIEVTETAYTTYAAALLWVVSHQIDFASLRSNGHEDRFAYLTKALDSDPFLPAPASLKSVYRLAHLLELDELRKIALSAFIRQLNNENAARELFCDASCAYPEIRSVTLNYVVKHYSAVKRSAAWTDMKKCADAGDLPIGTSHTLMLLSERLT